MIYLILDNGGETMALSKTRKCEQCTIVTPLENLKLFPTKDGKGYRFLCTECGEQFKKRASPNAGASQARGAPAAAKTSEQKSAQTKEPQKAQPKEALVCLRCNYKFKADLDKAGVSYNLVCPYCGRKDQIRPYNSPLL